MARLMGAETKSQARVITGGIGLWDVRVFVHEDVRERPTLGSETFVLKGAHVENVDRETGRMSVRLSDGSVDVEHDYAYLFWLELSLARVDFGRYSTTITGALDEVHAYRDPSRVSRERCTESWCTEDEDRPPHDIIEYRPPALNVGQFRYVTLMLRPHKEEE